MLTIAWFWAKLPKGDKMTDLRYEILKLLKSEQPGFVSGESICRRLGISRTAIWKHIEALRGEGYEIEARPRAGYSLLLVPDVLLPSEWQPGLQTILIGQQARYFKTTGSTNDVAKVLAKQGCAEGTVVVTDEQTGGRGRLGRSWQCPARAGLCFSVVLYPRVNPMEVTQIAILAAVAVARALAREPGLPARVKWPNDVYVNGKKVCGILAEMVAETDFVKYLVLGIGLNVNQSQDDLGGLGKTASSLSIERGQKVNRAEVLRAVLEELDVLYAFWQREGFIPIRQMWKELALWQGEPVVVRGLQSAWEGIARDIDDQGALIVEFQDGNTKKFYSGEVSLRWVGQWEPR